VGLSKRRERILSRSCLKGASNKKIEPDVLIDFYLPYIHMVVKGHICREGFPPQTVKKHPDTSYSPHIFTFIH